MRVAEELEPVEPAGPSTTDEGEGRTRRPRWPLVLAALVVVAVVLGGLLRDTGTRDDPIDRADVRKIAGASVDDAIEKLQGEPARSAQVYDTILPSLVVIRRPGAAGSTDIGLGTGVVIDADGRILTSLHVVDEAETLELTFSDGTSTAGYVAATDPDNDIAVVLPNILPEVVVPAVLGGGVDVGDEVIAVGHPLGLVASLSDGVVSGLDRSAPVAGGRTLERLIQFDAAVNPGNSGGPLLDRNGRVVGIVTALANPSDQTYFIGIGFAVPISTAGGAVDAPPR